jgi:hypothetical protein
VENFSEINKACVLVFNSVASATSWFVLPLFMLKVVGSSLLGEGIKAFQFLKGTLTYFLLIAAFPFILEILFLIPETLLPNAQSLFGASTSSPSWDSVSIIPYVVDRTLDVVLALLYWIAYYLHIFFMLIMCSMAPVVFLTSTILGIGLGMEVFLGLLIVGSSWPFIWFGFDQVNLVMSSGQQDSFGLRCLELLLTLFKAVSPILFAGLVVKSPAGQAVTSAVNAAKGGVWSYRQVASGTKFLDQKFRDTNVAKRMGFKPREVEPTNEPGTNRFSRNNRLKKAAAQKAKQQPNREVVSNANPLPRNS